MLHFTGLKISGAYLIDLEKKSDDRGFLTRVWDEREFAAQGIDFTIRQGYLTKSAQAGTLRGFHFLKVPEQKLTRVVRGSVYEVIIDIRPDSKTFKQWQGFTLKATDYQMLYLGPGIAHAILTLEDNTEMTSFYSPEYDPANEAGICYNDPAFKITWPIPVTQVSSKDLAWKDWK